MVYDNIRRIFRRSGAATWTKRKSFIVNKWCATGSKLHEYLGLELASHDHAINNCITYTSLPVAACLLHVNISDLRYTLHTQRRMQTEVTGHDPPTFGTKCLTFPIYFGQYRIYKSTRVSPKTASLSVQPFLYSSLACSNRRLVTPRGCEWVRPMYTPF